MDLYAETILEHYRHPQGKNLLKTKTVDHDEVNLSCGDSLHIQLFIENNTVKEIGWDGTGCAISQAAMSILWEELQEKSIQDIEKLRKEDMYKLLGVPVGPRRFKCALLCLHTLKNALRKAEGKEPQSWLETVEIEN